MSLIKKIGIGSAQFGFNYSVNQKRRTSLKNQKKIFHLAKKKNISFIDTAINYRLSETNIGLSKNNNFKIISKIPKISKKNINPEIIEKILKSSLSKVKEKFFYGVLFHDVKFFNTRKGQKIFKYLLDLKKKKLIKKIGASIYSPSDLKLIKNKKIDIIQIPSNIIDRRFNYKILSDLKKRGIEIHIRSIFLQGILLKANYRFLKKNPQLTNVSKKFDNFCKYYKLSKLEACLIYVFSIKKIDKIIIGLDNFDQFVKILKTVTKIEKNRNNYKNFINDSISLSSRKLKVIDPRLWR